MKRFHFISLFAAASVIAACEVAEPLEVEQRLFPQNLVELEEPELQTFVFSSAEEDDATKTVHTEGTIHWSAGDQIRMGYTVNGTWQGAAGNATGNSPAMLYPSDPLSSGGAAAYFTVPGYFPATGTGEYHFYTVYPASAVAENFSSAPETTVTIPTEQTPAAGSFDPAADLMVGYSVRTYDSKPTEAIPLMWERKVAHGEITLKNLTQMNGFSTSETIQRVTLTAQDGAALTGAYSLNLVSRDLTALEAASEASNIVSVSGDGLDYAIGNLTFWIGILPVTVTDLTITLETDLATYTRSFTGITREFLVNTHNKLGINMAAATRTAKAYYLVESAPEDWSGDYVIARTAPTGTTEGTTYAMGGQNGTSNFSSVQTVTVTDNAISLAEGSPLNVKIEKSTNGYTLKFGNKYLGYTASTSNSLYYSTTIEANKYEWTIELDEDNLVAISNVNKTDRQLRLNSSQKDRYACYASTSPMWKPSLYRLSGGPSGGDTPPTPDPEATATVTTIGAENITQSTATLNGSFSGNTGAISEVGFFWGTSQNNLDHTKLVADVTSPSEFHVDLSGLDPGTVYYYQAYVKEENAASQQIDVRSGEIKSFTTGTSGNYVLVESDPGDWSGTYVLGYMSSSSATTATLLAGISTTSTPYGTLQENVAVSGGEIAYSAGQNFELTIAKTTGDNYSISLGGIYLGWSSGNSLAGLSSFITGTCEWTISYSNGTLTIASVEDSSRKLQYNNGSPRFACYTSAQQAPSLFVRSSSSGGGTLTATVTTKSVLNVLQNSATLRGSFSDVSGGSVTEVGFYMGETADPATKIPADETSSNFTQSVSGLTAGKIYYFKAYVVVGDAEFTGSVLNFSTISGGTSLAGYYLGCYEIPGVGTVSGHSFGDERYGYSQSGSTKYTKWQRWNTSNSKQKIVTHTFYNDLVGQKKAMRNFTLLQDFDKKCALWVACVMNNDVYPKKVDRSDGWAYDPALDNNWQPNLTNSYPDKNGNSYDRGHQLAASYRETTTSQVKMTCYFTNMTPQLSSLNQGVWQSTVENNVRALGEATSGSDTLYVVSGPLFIGSYGTVEDIDGMSCAKPTHYFQCFMKVSFNNNQVPQSAKGAAYLVEHKASPTVQYVSIDHVENLAGFDFFANVPSDIQNAAEAAPTPYSSF